MPNKQIYFSDQERADAQRRNARVWYNRHKKVINSTYGTKESKTAEYHKKRYAEQKLKNKEKSDITNHDITNNEDIKGNIISMCQEVLSELHKLEWQGE